MCFFAGEEILNVNSEARAPVVDGQKQSGGLFLGRGLYVFRTELKYERERCKAALLNTPYP